ncbi:unnamed protein product [Diamesa tonsa]
MFSIKYHFILGVMIWACGFVNSSVISHESFVECSGESCDYPEDLIEAQDLDKFKDQFKTSSKFKRNTYPDSSYLVEQSLCRSRIQIINPRKLKALDGEMKSIVNHGQYNQEVRTEICE